MIESEIVLSGFLVFYVFSCLNFTFAFYGFHLKKLKIIQSDFELARRRK